MIGRDRLRAEQEFHDRQAAQRAPGLLGAEALQVSDSWYLAHESWIAPALERLGEVAGRRVLDLGCGHGMASVVLARRGARVTAVDLSAGYLAEARRRALANGVEVAFVQAAGERLPFTSGSFECIWGNAILHHLDLVQTARELHRLLAPDGVAVFSEPWGGNPLLSWARRYLPYPGKERTVHEHPLRRADLLPLEEAFRSLRVEGVQLFSMLRRVVGPGKAIDVLEQADRYLLRQAPFLRWWCRYVLITLRP